jgi:hypothetical protein
MRITAAATSWLKKIRTGLLPFSRIQLVNACLELISKQRAMKTGIACQVNPLLATRPARKAIIRTLHDPYSFRKLSLAELFIL